MTYARLARRYQAAKPNSTRVGLRYQGNSKVATATAVRFSKRGTKTPLTSKLATRTLTATKKKLNQGVHESRAGSDSFFFLSHKPSRIGKFTGKMSKISRTVNSNAIVTSTAGRQTITDIGSCFGYTDTQNMMNQAIVQQYGSSTPTGYKTERILYKSALCEYTYTNSTNAVARLLLFDIIPRTDIYNTAGDANSPKNSWDDGINDEIAGGGANNSQFVGSMPFASEKFCHFFNIKKITTVNLAPGQMHVHRVKYSPNKILTNELLSQGNVVYFKGLSLNHMMVQYGQPVLDNSGGVTTEATKILCVSKWSYEFTFLPNNMTTTVITNTLGLTAGANLEDIATGASAAFAAV